MIDRLEPLQSGRDTEIDMIEREMEGGVLVIQPPDVQEHHVEKRAGSLVAVKEHVTVRAIRSTPSVAPKG